MTELLVAAWATACVLTAIEELLITLGRWRGLLALTMSTVACFVLRPIGWDQIFYILAAAFIGLISSVVVESLIAETPERIQRGLPRRVPRM
jgi:chromate transport protein ChrA